MYYNYGINPRTQKMGYQYKKANIVKKENIVALNYANDKMAVAG